MGSNVGIPTAPLAIEITVAGSAPNSKLPRTCGCVAESGGAVFGVLTIDVVVADGAMLDVGATASGVVDELARSSEVHPVEISATDAPKHAKAPARARIVPSYGRP